MTIVPTPVQNSDCITDETDDRDGHGEKQEAEFPRNAAPEHPVAAVGLMVGLLGGRHAVKRGRGFGCHGFSLPNARTARYPGGNRTVRGDIPRAALFRLTAACRV